MGEALVEDDVALDDRHPEWCVYDLNILLGTCGISEPYFFSEILEKLVPDLSF